MEAKDYPKYCPFLRHSCPAPILESTIHDQNNVIQAIQGELELIYLERGEHGKLERLFETLAKRKGGSHGKHTDKKDIRNDPV